MKKCAMLAILVCLIPLATIGQTSQSSERQQEMSKMSPEEVAPLNLVIQQVEEALNKYQKNLGSGTDALPPLSSAEFDFKTTTGKTVGVTINLLIFKFGTSHEKDVTNDVTYTYTVPKPPATPPGKSGNQKPPVLEDQLAQTIQTAAAAVKTAHKLGKLNFSKLTVNLQYGVKWDISGGGSYTFSLITVGISGDVNKNTVQSVKLVFGQ